MEVRLQKWGNSIGIRIPNIIKSLNLKENDILVLEQTDDKILITIPKKKKIDLEELFKI